MTTTTTRQKDLIGYMLCEMGFMSRLYGEFFSVSSPQREVGVQTNPTQRNNIDIYYSSEVVAHPHLARLKSVSQSTQVDGGGVQSVPHEHIQKHDSVNLALQQTRMMRRRQRSLGDIAIPSDTTSDTVKLCFFCSLVLCLLRDEGYESAGRTGPGLIHVGSERDHPGFRGNGAELCHIGAGGRVQQKIGQSDIVVDVTTNREEGVEDAVGDSRVALQCHPAGTTRLLPQTQDEISPLLAA